MDTSKEYIRMCEKADEIQEARIPRKDDILLHDICPKCMLETEVHPNPMYMHTCEHCKWSGNYNDLLFIWLPRQDQLQDMLKEVIKNKYISQPTHIVSLLIKEIAEYASCGREGEFRYPSFKTANNGSMEQLWLAFVMKEKYNKIWNGEKWEKI